jgi:hypothetical protein
MVFLICSFLFHTAYSDYDADIAETFSNVRMLAKPEQRNISCGRASNQLKSFGFMAMKQLAMQYAVPT